MPKLTKKAIEKKVETAFYKVGYGVQLPMMKLPLIYKAGEMAVLAGKTDEEVEAVVKAEVEKYKVA